MANSKSKTKEVSIPLNEQPGRCKNCAAGSFTLRLYKGVLYRKCSHCGEVVDVDRMVMKRKGDERLKWSLEDKC